MCNVCNVYACVSLTSDKYFLDHFVRCVWDVRFASNEVLLRFHIEIIQFITYFISQSQKRLQAEKTIQRTLYATIVSNSTRFYVYFSITIQKSNIDLHT